MGQIITWDNWQKRETMLSTRLPLVLLMVVAVNFSMANPIKNNVEEDHDMNNAMEGKYKFTRSAEFIDEEDSKKASWETSRREKLYALILSFVLGIFGADWFYLCVTSETYIVIGVIKLVACGIGGVICGLAACDCRVNIKNAKDMVALLAGLLVFGWWLVDWVRILLDEFPDGMGRPLLPFSYTIP